MTPEIKPGDTVRVSHDIVVGNQVAFRSSEQVVVESISPNTQRPEYKYVVFSQRLQKKFQLSDNDIGLPVVTWDATRAPLSAAMLARDPSQGNQLELLFGRSSATPVTSSGRYGTEYLIPHYGANFTRALKYQTTTSGSSATVVVSFNSNFIRDREAQIPANTVIKFSELSMTRKNGKWLITKCLMYY